MNNCQWREQNENHALTYESEIWDKVSEYADKCSWSAGAYLAKEMREHFFTDWERVFAAVNEDEIEGYCTLAKTDCIPGVSYTPYIGFMFVGEPYRSRRLSQHLIQYALDYAKTLNFKQVYLVSGEQGLYEKYGFYKLETAKDYKGREEQIFTIYI